MTASAVPQPLIEVRLYGHLRARFGRSYHLAVRSAAEAVYALGTVVPGFRQHLRAHNAPGYRVWLGADVVRDAGELKYPPGRLIRIVPVMAGAGGRGVGQIFLGAALIGLSFVLPVTPLISGFAFSASSIAFSVGVSMVLGGISQALAGSPKTVAPSERPNNQPSYAFNGAVNTTAQGNPVPILIGRMRVGSQVISSGLSTAPLP